MTKAKQHVDEAMLRAMFTEALEMVPPHQKEGLEDHSLIVYTSEKMVDRVNRYIDAKIEYRQSAIEKAAEALTYYQLQYDDPMKCDSLVAQEALNHLQPFLDD